MLYVVTIPLALSNFSLVYFGLNHDEEGYLPWECPPSAPSLPLLQQLPANLPVLFFYSFWGYSDTIYHPISKAATAYSGGCAVCIHNEDELLKAKCRLGRSKNSSSPTYDSGYSQRKWHFADDNSTRKIH